MNEMPRAENPITDDEIDFWIDGDDDVDDITGHYGAHRAMYGRGFRDGVEAQCKLSSEGA